VTGTGADRTLTVARNRRLLDHHAHRHRAGRQQRVTQVQYGVSAYLGDPSQRYFSGAGNGSTAIDVGDGYMIVGDDESNVLHLYNETQSGPPVATYDFTGELPEGTTSVDIESSARAGDMLYWTGSMTNDSSGDLAPARSTLFAAKITGSGADTQLTYVGSYSEPQETTWSPGTRPTAAARARTTSASPRRPRPGSTRTTQTRSTSRAWNSLRQQHDGLPRLPRAA
jgi:hypothetical protein